MQWWDRYPLCGPAGRYWHDILSYNFDIPSLQLSSLWRDQLSPAPGNSRPLMQMRREMRRDERAGDHQVRLGLRPPGNITLISGPDFLHISLNTFWSEGGGREGGSRTCGNSWCLRWGDLGTMSGHTGSVSEYMDTPSTSFGFSQIREKQKTEEPLCSIIRLSVDLPATVLAPSVSSWSDPLSDPLCYPLCYPTTNEHCLPHI